MTATDGTNSSTEAGPAAPLTSTDAAAGGGTGVGGGIGAGADAGDVSTTVTRPGRVIGAVARPPGPGGVTDAAPGRVGEFEAVVRGEYGGIAAGYLDTAAFGLAPARTVAAMRGALDAWASGRPDVDGYEAAVAASRTAYARITGVAPDRVALAGTVAQAVGLIAAGLPEAAQVVVAADDFSSLVHPFAGRPGLDLRIVPLDEVAAAVGPGTALVAVSAAQSLDGRVADLPAIRAATTAHGARLLIDGTQSVGWLPLAPEGYDYLVCHAYKWLVSPHGACFLTVREGLEPTLSPASAGWYAAADPWNSCYGPIEELAPGARRFDARPPYLSYVGAAASLALVEELGVAAVRAHDLALADRLRSGLTALGHAPVPGDSAIVAVPGMPGSAAARLNRACPVRPRPG
ncbi:aminotransferase class V-fold PLP-dependent enzyme [Streptomyces sp. NBC_01476]|uniref:aminotransferase class V-fold PLP-dependent enzyme n=1 Tax=Streptomyces sp. NBC_01476 TaxID=2903881 RepID=UPI002E324FED|nr:aminotransferase class V-fold PLP-dependent enzyme [Streptomyces sp. NBC_01476]